MRVFKTPHELMDAVGDDLGETEWLVIDQARINTFAEATGDHQWIHVDEKRCKAESPYGTTIAHGYFTLSLYPQLRGIVNAKVHSKEYLFVRLEQ